MTRIKSSGVGVEQKLALAVWCCSITVDCMNQLDWTRKSLHSFSESTVHIHKLALAVWYSLGFPCAFLRQGLQTPHPNQDLRYQPI